MQLLLNMRITIDTSALIRFFTRDIEEKAQKVKKLLDSDTNIFIPNVVFPELEYVLIKTYGVKREDLDTYFKFLTSKNNLKTTKDIKVAVEIYQKTKLDMADCIIAAESLKGLLASFDKVLLKVENVKPFWK
ncbi:MAG: hypothetical protein US51_C0003G0011 [Microgenomates group bacterium GW2011_GWA2_37_6]|nr:MAG: hypothetical protein US51_C0003G0011 [Microgenomates group bacterium GW2011_GWA2_37_6]